MWPTKKSSIAKDTIFDSLTVVWWFSSTEVPVEGGPPLPPRYDGDFTIFQHLQHYISTRIPKYIAIYLCYYGSSANGVSSSQSTRRDVTIDDVKERKILANKSNALYPFLLEMLSANNSCVHRFQTCRHRPHRWFGNCGSLILSSYWSIGNKL
jgi:hypothetical protein